MQFELKRWKERYVPSLARYADDPTIAENIVCAASPFPQPFTSADAASFLERRRLADEETEFARAIIVGDEAVGSVLITRGVGARACCGELTFWLGRPFRRCGIMSAALALACDAAFEQLGLSRIQAQPLYNNIAARNALNNADFTFEGKMPCAALSDGRPTDLCMYSITANDRGQM